MSKRDTTGRYDAAPCQMGICSVRMSLNSMGIGVSVDIICNAVQAGVGPMLRGDGRGLERPDASVVGYHANKACSRQKRCEICISS